MTETSLISVEEKPDPSISSGGFEKGRQISDFLCFVLVGSGVFGRMYCLWHKRLEIVYGWWNWIISAVDWKKVWKLALEHRKYMESS